MSQRRFLLFKVSMLCGVLLFALAQSGLASAIGRSAASNAPAADPNTPLPFLDDFQSGIPSGFVGFADSWDGSGSSTTLSLSTATSDLPTIPAMAGTTVASVTYNIATSGSWGGGPGYAGVTRDFTATKDLSQYQALRFWYKGSNTGMATQVELKTAGTNVGGYSDRFVYSFTDSSSDWRFFAIPFSSFVKRTDYNPGAALGDTPDLTLVWGYSILLPVTSGSFSIDEISVTGYSSPVTDFQPSGPPAGFVGFADSWDGSGSATTLALTYPSDDLPTVPTQDGTTVATVTYNVASSGSWGGGPGYAGVTQDFSSSQSWFNFQGFSFWYKGGNTGAAMRVEIKTDGPSAGASNHFEYGFTDNFSDWRYFSIPWSSFTKRTDYNPGAGLGDSINHSVMWGYSFLIPGGAAGSFSIDDVAAYGGGGGLPHAKFSSATYSVNEADGSATITVNLDSVSSSPVSVDYATSNGTAVAGTDYTAASGTLNFAAGQTTKTFAVPITNDSVFTSSKTVNLALSNPSAATLGTPNTAVLTIIDDDSSLPFLDNFESGIPSGFVAFADSWDGSGSSTTISLGTATDNLPTVPPMNGTTVASVTYHIATSGSWGGGPGYAGVSRDFASSVDLSGFNALRFWYKGSNTGMTTKVELKTAGTNVGGYSNRFVYSFTDDSSSWRYFVLPFNGFVKRTDYNPGAALGDSPDLTVVWGYSILLPVADGSFAMDEVSVTGFGTTFDFESGIPSRWFVGFIGYDRR